MLLITTTRLLQLQTRYLCDFNLIPDDVAALLRLTHLTGFVTLFVNYMRDAHAGPFATRNARACVPNKKMTWQKITRWTMSRHFPAADP